MRHDSLRDSILALPEIARGRRVFIGLGWLGAFLVLLTRAHAQEPPRYAWRKITLNAPFAPRDGAGALTFRDRIWLLGGWNPDARQKEFFPLVCNNEVWSSGDGADWALVKPNTFKDRKFDSASDWEGRHTAGYAVFRDRMWIIGGDANQGHYQNDVWNSADGRSWHRVNPGRDVRWGPRALHYTLVHQDALWVIGGQTMPAFAGGGEKLYRDAWTSTDGVEWRQVVPEDPAWSARGMIGGSAVLNGRIWILGGGTYDTPATPKRQYHNDVWSSVDGIHWKKHTDAAPWHPRQYHDVAAWDGRLWVMEGYHETGGNRNDVWHSADGARWHEIPNTPWKPRHAASLFVFQDSLWMVAGNNMEPDVWRLTRAAEE
jgi:hypothetical protein